MEDSTCGTCCKEEEIIYRYLKGQFRNLTINDHEIRSNISQYKESRNDTTHIQYPENLSNHMNNLIYRIKWIKIAVSLITT